MFCTIHPRRMHALMMLVNGPAALCKNGAIEMVDLYTSLQYFMLYGGKGGGVCAKIIYISSNFKTIPIQGGGGSGHAKIIYI